MLRLKTDRLTWQPAIRRQPVELAEGDDRELLVECDNVPALAQVRTWERDAEDIARLRRILRYGMKWQTSGAQPRLSGIKAANEYFGTIPPVPTRRRYACRLARIYEDIPEFKPLMERITARVVEPFKQLFPEQYAEHDRLVRAEIHNDWLIDGHAFTSGIINNTAALPYHKDSGNLAGTWSVMLCLRDNVDGGSLDIPEFGVTLAVPDESLVIFNGQEAWHGVTPFFMKAKNSYRFTLVWYVKRQIVNCLCVEDEWKRAAQHATAVHDEYSHKGDDEQVG